MHLHDPSRASCGGHPQIYWDGRAVGAMPRLELFPLPDIEEIEVQIMLVVGPNRASWHTTTIKANQLGPFIDAWNANPELVAQEHFGWTYSAKPSEPLDKPNGKPELSIDDLI